ncbi:Asp-tRNA(Asn)/Glu-tRNA(Gln) amidotransferase subunit GatA [Candidatus Pacearchaeota archaeon]|nr:Asp-tRNA(Asn)/Glu-tRNA(Gln) amidotransferase subunit GatA [Candidatus Pacearchaeota archaeon]
MTSTLQKLQQYLKEIEKNDKNGKKINAFLQLNPDAEKEARTIDAKKSKGNLAGKIIAVKANINVLGLNASCASKALENYKSTYDADVIKKIKNEDGLIIGITNMDEFACGGSGETSAFGPTRNPQDINLIPGGSSSGSAAAVAAGFCDIALGSDTGGSIRNPASHCGVVGIKPTYGSVSRNGLIDLSMSLDQIGPIARNVSDAALLLEVIYGKNENDAISEGEGKINSNEIDKIPKNLNIGILDFKSSDKRIDELISKKIEAAAKKHKWKTKKISISHIDLAIETYYPLVYVEFFSGTRRFDGRKYGKKIEDSAGAEVLRRILGGSEISKAEHHGRYYNKSLAVKKIIESEMKKIFKGVDCIISPTVPRIPHKIGEKISVEEMYSYDMLTIPANLAGNCALSIPSGEIQGVPVGMQIMCDKFQEMKMLQIANCFERV